MLFRSGIAKLFGMGNEMTQTGTQMGTPIYMSPEQVRSEKSIDFRSDIYSMGVTLYFAINGKPPYDSDTNSQFDIFNKIVFEPLPELQGNSRYNSIIQKACQKNREDRFQSCAEWIQMMGSAPVMEKTKLETATSAPLPKNEERTILESGNTISNQPSPPVQQNSNKSKWVIIGVVGGVLLIALIGLLFYLGQENESRGSSHDTEETEAVSDEDSENTESENDEMESDYKYEDSEEFKDSAAMPAPSVPDSYNYYNDTPAPATDVYNGYNEEKK